MHPVYDAEDIAKAIVRTPVKPKHDVEVGVAAKAITAVHAERRGPTAGMVVKQTRVDASTDEAAPASILLNAPRPPHAAYGGRGA